MRPLHIAVGIILALMITIALGWRYPTQILQNSSTETNLPIVGHARDYGLLLLGSSHARTLSRFSNHSFMEHILNRPVINLAQGGNRESVKNQYLYLSYFYQRQNTTSTVIYLLDPYVFFRHSLLQSPRVFDREPFRFDFLLTLLREGERSSKTLSYLRSAFSSKNLPPTTTKKTTSTAERHEARRKELYREEPSAVMIKEDLDYLLKIVELAHRHRTRIIIIVPPTLLPRTNQDDRVMGMLKMLRRYRTFELYDLSTAIPEQRYYIDSDHLNTDGVVLLLKTKLLPILKNR